MNRKKKEFAIALALLSASSALCLRIMKKVDEKLRREKEKRTRKRRRKDVRKRKARRRKAVSLLSFRCFRRQP